MRVGFIGAGKAGYSLAKYLSLNGIVISGFYSRDYENAKDAACFVGTQPYTTKKELINNSNLIFITTNDNAISQVWEEIKGQDINNKYICHISGTLDSGVFYDIEEYGAYGYSIHPIYPFSDKYQSYLGLDSAYFSIEGNNNKISEVKDMFNKVGNKIVIIKKETKPLYHLASVTVSNLVLSLVETGSGFLNECGFKDEESLEALMPLIHNNIRNISQKGIVGALTGPVERRDIDTIHKHLEVMPDEFLYVYKFLSKNLAKLSIKKNIDKDYSQINKELA